MRRHAAWLGVSAIAGGALLSLAAISSLPPEACAREEAAVESIPSQPLVEGRALFQEKGCAQCHSIWTTKEEGVSFDLARKGSWKDVMQLAGSLWNHAPTMANEMRKRGIKWSPVSPEEMGKLVGYLFYARFAGETGDVQRGGDLFERRHCAQCHQLAGRGGTMGPRLDELKEYASTFFFAQALWNHGPEMATKMAEIKITRPHLDANDVADLVAFLRGEGGSAASVELSYAQTANARSGKAVFEAKGCVKCHGTGGTGSKVGPSLAQGREQHATGLAGALWNHGPAMWAKMKDLGVPFQRMTEREMADLLAYLCFVQYTSGSGDAAKGGEIFAAKSCARCHALGSGGPRVGPDLSVSAATLSPFHWAAAMWDHAPAMSEKMRQEGPEWPLFENDEMRNLVEFLKVRQSNK